MCKRQLGLWAGLFACVTLASCVDHMGNVAPLTPAEIGASTPPGEDNQSRPAERHLRPEDDDDPDDPDVISI